MPNSQSDIKLLNPKYLLIILLVVIIYSVFNNYVPFLSFLAWLVIIIACYIAVSKIKKSTSGSISESDKLSAVFFMAVSPIIAQAFYYYRLRKVSLQNAKAYNKLGWKVLGMEIVIALIVGAAGSALTMKK